MNDEAPFRIAFFSNSSNDSYPEIKPSNFHVKLAHPTDFTGRWECALTDLHMVNFKNGIRLGYNQIAIYRFVKKNRTPKNRDRNTAPPLKDALNMPKNTFLMPSQSSVAEVVKYIN